ncbi:hypothetical protein [Microbacterium sp. LWH13-1.2]|uniref:hypothetical protein n=1 Tax=Microbacterium sp. LWH13-1.2 TaxID=3135260 RepID=UPI003139278E
MDLPDLLGRHRALTVGLPTQPSAVRAHPVPADIVPRQIGPRLPSADGSRAVVAPAPRTGDEEQAEQHQQPCGDSEQQEGARTGGRQALGLRIDIPRHGGDHVEGEFGGGGTPDAMPSRLRPKLESDLHAHRLTVSDLNLRDLHDAHRSVTQRGVGLRPLDAAHVPEQLDVVGEVRVAGCLGNDLAEPQRHRQVGARWTGVRQQQRASCAVTRRCDPVADERGLGGGVRATRPVQVRRLAVPGGRSDGAPGIGSNVGCRRRCRARGAARRRDPAWLD